MKLYRITVNYDVLVAAENEDDAASLGIDKAELALREMTDQPDIYVAEITAADQIPKEWRRCYPYRDDNTTPMQCEQYLSASGPEKP